MKYLVLQFEEVSFLMVQYMIAKNALKLAFYQQMHLR
jgi:hypothetical protein